MTEIRNLFHKRGSLADLRYKEKERKGISWAIVEKITCEEYTLDWSPSKVFLVTILALSPYVYQCNLLFNFTRRVNSQHLHLFGIHCICTNFSDSDDIVLLWQLLCPAFIWDPAFIGSLTVAYVIIIADNIRLFIIIIRQMKSLHQKLYRLPASIQACLVFISKNRRQNMLGSHK